MKYKCKFPGCNYGTDNSHGLAGHVAGHVKRGEVLKEKTPVAITEAFLSGVVAPAVTASQIADALLKRVVSGLSEYDNLKKEVNELKGYKEGYLRLEKELHEEALEKERILKIHNDQVKNREFTTTETLKRLAGL